MLFLLILIFSFNGTDMLRLSIKYYAKINGINPEIALAVAHKESRFLPDVKSKTDDYGLFQIHCGKKWSWCRYYKIKKSMLLNPVVNIVIAIDIMKKLKKYWNKKKGKKRPSHWLGYWNNGKNYTKDVLRIIKRRQYER